MSQYTSAAQTNEPIRPLFSWTVKVRTRCNLSHQAMNSLSAALKAVQLEARALETAAHLGWRCKAAQTRGQRTRKTWRFVAKPVAQASCMQRQIRYQQQHAACTVELLWRNAGRNVAISLQDSKGEDRQQQHSHLRTSSPLRPVEPQ